MKENEGIFGEVVKACLKAWKQEDMVHWQSPVIHRVAVL